MKDILSKNISSSLLVENRIRLKKKNSYSKKLFYYFSKLNSFLANKQAQSRKSKFFFKNSNVKSEKLLLEKGSFIAYSVCFSFTMLNTFLYVTDASGKLKFSSSSGLQGFSGKAKRNRFQVLKLFLKDLRKLKLNFLKANPVALCLRNVGSYKRFIIRHVKKKLFIKVIKNYQVYSYNGCRKKKKLRK